MFSNPLQDAGLFDGYALTSEIFELQRFKKAFFLKKAFYSKDSKTALQSALPAAVIGQTSFNDVSPFTCFRIISAILDPN